MFACVLDSNKIIANIIVVEKSSDLGDFGAYPYYSEAVIGAPYNPPIDLSDSERIKVLETENALLKAQLQAQSDRSDFIEDCIAEMAMQVYN